MTLKLHGIEACVSMPTARCRRQQRSPLSADSLERSGNRSLVVAREAVAILLSPSREPPRGFLASDGRRARFRHVDAADRRPALRGA